MIFDFLIFVFVLLPNVCFADGINSGDTAWMLVSSVLVLFMTIPGLALFYGGMVRKKYSFSKHAGTLQQHALLVYFGFL